MSNVLQNIFLLILNVLNFSFLKYLQCLFCSNFFFFFAFVKTKLADMSLADFAKTDFYAAKME